MKKRLLIILGGLGGILLALLIILVVMLPDIDRMDGCFTTTLHQVEVCPDHASYVRLNQISDTLKNAVVITEDGTFFKHTGFDFHELKLSFKTNWEKKKYARGGSTITQQVAKNAFLSSNKSLFRKAREALLAIQIEKQYSKQKILETYLNMIEFGQGIYGIKQASFHYFQKPPSDLNILESAYLAYLIPAPKGRSDDFEQGLLSDYAKERIEFVIERMVLYKHISMEEALWAQENIRAFPWRHLGVRSRHSTFKNQIDDEIIAPEKKDVILELDQKIEEVR